MVTNSWCLFEKITKGIAEDLKKWEKNALKYLTAYNPSMKCSAEMSFNKSITEFQRKITEHKAFSALSLEDSDVKVRFNLPTNNSLKLAENKY